MVHFPPGATLEQLSVSPNGAVAVIISDSVLLL
jgi:hypothetical protein